MHKAPKVLSSRRSVSRWQGLILSDQKQLFNIRHPQATECFLEHLDILDVLVDHRFGIQNDPDLDNRFSLRFMSIRAQIDVKPSPKTVDEDEGACCDYSYISVISVTFWGVRVFRKAIRSTISYRFQEPDLWLGLHCEISYDGFFERLVMPFFERQFYKGAQVFLDSIEEAAKLVRDHKEEAMAILTPEQTRNLLDHLARRPWLIKSSVISVHPSGEGFRVSVQVNVPPNERIESGTVVGADIESFSARLDSLLVRSLQGQEQEGHKEDLEHKEHEEVVAVRRPEDRGGRSAIHRGLSELGHDIYQAFIGRHSELNGAVEQIMFHPLTEREYVSVRIKLRCEDGTTRIPWEVMNDGEVFLATKIGMARITTEVHKFRKRETDYHSVLLAGCDNQGELPRVEQEVSEIEEELAKKGVLANRLARGEATPETIVHELESGKYQVFHFAGHSVYDPERPQTSYLVCDGENLHADMLASLVDAAGVQLVFLSACYSGYKAEQRGGILGISDCFVRMGIPYVVGMQWAVSDEEAALMAGEFYQQLIQWNDPVEAMKRARKELAIKRQGSLIWCAPVIYTQYMPEVPMR